MPPLDPLTTLIRDTVAGLGFELVDARAVGPPRRLSLRVRIDRPGSRPGTGVTSGDCTWVARVLRGAMAASYGVDPVDTLEVSSPGIERPIRFPEHWRRFIGERVKLRSVRLAGRPVGVIVDVPDDEHVILGLEDGEQTLALADIREATLVVDWSGV